VVKILKDPNHYSPVRFAREAEIGAVLSYPGSYTVPVWDMGETKNSFPYLTMDYCPGGSLREHLATHGQPSCAAVRRWALALVIALGNCAKYGIVHRDLKPENIFLTADLGALLADFGLARWGPASVLTQPDDWLGTLAYSSPELLDNPTQVDSASDVFSLELMLYELLEGKLPFSLSSKPNRDRHRKKLMELKPQHLEFSPENTALSEIVRGCLEGHTRQRISLDELREKLGHKEQ
jgi:serine/threonine protein kinase